MTRDRLHHRQHAEGTDLETIQPTNHPILESGTVARCPHDSCRYRELRDYEIGHEFALPFDLEERLTTIRNRISLPVIHTYHTAGGHREGRKAFQTRDEAEAYIFGRYGGNGNRPATGRTIRKTYSRTSGTHCQTADPKEYPMVCAIVDTHQNKVVYSNLVPQEEDIPENAPHWQKSVEDRVNYHLNPPKHIVDSKFGVNDEFARTPDDYPHDELSWHIEQVQHWDVQIQTPELFLDADGLDAAAKHADGYTHPNTA